MTFFSLSQPALGVLLSAAAGLAVVLSVIAVMSSRRLRRNIQRLLGETDRERISEALADYYRRVQIMERSVKTLTADHAQTAATARRSIHRTGIKRFNPFRGETGGDQSFSIALLDGTRSGILLTSLHARDGNRLYAKPIRNAHSDYPLSPEEQDILEQALSDDEPSQP